MVLGALILTIALSRPTWGYYWLDEPFLRAVLAKDSRSTDQWLKRGADINAMWKTHYSAVDIAMYNEDKRTASVLLRHGSSLSAAEALRLQGLIDVSLHVCTFDRKAWLKQELDSIAQPRGDMVTDLIDFHLPIGMSKEDVIALLGSPDFTFDTPHGFLSEDEISPTRTQSLRSELSYRVDTDTTPDGSSYAFDLEIGFDANDRLCAKGYHIE
ncbi:MAG: hypothetical protein JSS65_14210 [Armatimonadetes bacterium]|nr:hypothetical protein [Armatimonadota bacterium]